MVKILDNLVIDCATDLTPLDSSLGDTFFLDSP